MKQKGATLVQFVLLLALLVISVFVMLSLKKVFFWQAKNVETDVAEGIINTLSQEIERAQSYAQETSYRITIPYSAEYVANISSGKITLFFPERDVRVTKPFMIPNANVVDSTFSSSGVVYVYKLGRNIYVSNNLTCNKDDDKCDVGCIVEGVCDLKCYVDNTYDGVCNPFCVDRSGDGVINGRDIDAVCDPDCYNNEKQGFFYDPDCLKNGDNICDPDTHNSRDGFCDRDCLGTNGVCDPDCKEYDADCSHKNNGRCELELGENCLYYPSDCACSQGTTCKAGCPLFPDTAFDEKGCVPDTLVKYEGDAASSGCECNGSLVLDFTGHCCPENTYFRGGRCVPFDNDGICNTTSPYFPAENCANSGDCSCSGGEVCCPHSPTSAQNGCAAIQTGTGLNALCGCNEQCSTGKCSNGHCCEKGYEWNGSQCVLDCSDCTNPDIFALCPNCNCQLYTGETDPCNAGESCCPNAGGANADTGCITGENYAVGQSCDCDNQCGNENNQMVCSRGHCCPVEVFQDNRSLIEWGYFNGNCYRYVVWYDGDIRPDNIVGSKCGGPVLLGGNCQQVITSNICNDPNGNWWRPVLDCARRARPEINDIPSIIVVTNSSGPCFLPSGREYRERLNGLGVARDTPGDTLAIIYAQDERTVADLLDLLRDNEGDLSDADFRCN